MQTLNFIARLCDALSLLWPPRALRIMRQGASEAAVFRAWYKREPTAQEWREITNRIGRIS